MKQASSIAFTLILALEVGRSDMRLRRGGQSMMAAVGVICLGLSWSGTALAQVKLEHKYPEGKKLTYKTTTKMRQSLTLMGMEIDTNENRTTVLSLTAGKRRSDSNIPLERKIESLRTELALPGGINLTYDSSDPSAKIDNTDLAFLGELYKLISQISYTVVLDNQNNVKAIEGTEKLQEKADKLGQTARDLVRNQFETDKLKRSFEQELHILPNVLARPGEPWERTEILEIGGGQTLTFHKRYEYVGTEKQGNQALDKISSKVTEVTYKQDPDADTPLKVVKSNLKMDSSDGTILFDREKGHLVSSKGRMRIKGDLTFSANGAELAGTLDLRIESNQELLPSSK
jgi:hypothetical protein